MSPVLIWAQNDLVFVLNKSHFRFWHCAFLQNMWFCEASQYHNTRPGGDRPVQLQKVSPPCRTDRELVVITPTLRVPDASSGRSNTEGAHQVAGVSSG